ncbi:hypothetical protein W97_08437 [Coniosporium apollinis CBS 100218]|uniref:Uncharacterized protein n=1 Tax=Coniosporium apollinis (strain CBS 100218) TaxID=1168221 RepID=R7Z526_CONA1|nr:uncharacterized protein W97_08437 [Coniosporium apollinis CBS 100218]EON69277.1 hypothetical protein W97_08437 [Coniosporium apollinis CBS 100218]
MRFTLPTLILGLALTASACANDTLSHSHDSISATSITTHTSTRTVMRVVTETQTGVPPTSAAAASSSGYAASTGFLPASGNATVPAGTGFKATASPTASAKPFTGAGNALRGVGAGALAIAGGVAVFVL